jgi:hypothetical protein
MRNALKEDANKQRLKPGVYTSPLFRKKMTAKKIDNEITLSDSFPNEDIFPTSLLVENFQLLSNLSLMAQRTTN